MDNQLIGVSSNIQRIKELILKVADTCVNVLVCGETGVGKELVVQQLYKNSDRKNMPFIKVNCAALPNTLLESEMFGYERGAFTGAVCRKRGKFEQAKGGLLFLDEIGDMSIGLQSKLLHALQGGEFIPLGSETTIKSNSWVISATNQDLESDIEQGKFRRDLYYRINTITININPLRKRPEDIPLLIDHFTCKYSSQFKNKCFQTLQNDTLDRLMAYHWPGNVRELQNVIQRIIVLGENEQTLNEMIPIKNNRLRLSDNSQTNTAPSSFEYFFGQDLRQLDLSKLNLMDIKKKVSDQIEKKIILSVLEKTGWNRVKASKLLNISYRTVFNKMEELNIKPPMMA
jgi:transcriptional regulator with PAS, ATPase and Fis domain